MLEAEKNVQTKITFINELVSVALKASWARCELLRVLPVFLVEGSESLKTTELVFVNRVY